MSVSLILEKRVDMIPVLWDVDPLDWCKDDVDCIVRNVINIDRDQKCDILTERNKSQKRLERMKDIEVQL